MGDAEGGADGETVREGMLLETMEGTMEADTDGAMEGDTDGARDGVLLGADEGAAVVGAGNRTKNARERRSMCSFATECFPITNQKDSDSCCYVRTH